MLIDNVVKMCWSSIRFLSTHSAASHKRTQNMHFGAAHTGRAEVQIIFYLLGSIAGR